MKAPKAFRVEFVHQHSQMAGSWEVYATDKAQAMISARELLPESYNIVNVYPTPMFDD